MTPGKHMFNLAMPVYQHAQTHGERLALVVDGQSYSYAKLAARAAAVAGWLKGERAPRVGVLAARSIETYAGILGAAWSGGTFVPMNPKQPAARLRHIIERAGIDALVVDRRGTPHLEALGDALPRRVLAGSGWEKLPESSEKPAEVAPEHPAYILFTSGTTGEPKGVAISTGNMAHYLASNQAMFEFTAADRFGQFFETSFDPSNLEMFSCWGAGAASFVVPETKLMAPGGFIVQNKLTVWVCVPAVIGVMRKLKQLSPGALPLLRVTVIGGEPLPVESALTWRAAAPNSIVENHYGPTEATIACLREPVTETPAQTPGRAMMSIGRPLPGLHAEILGPGMEFLGPDQNGELAVSGPQLAIGYVGDEAQTARRFVTLDHPALGRSRWYLTGDLAMRDRDGRFHCLGRMDNQVKVMGHRVELEDVEAHLRSAYGLDSVAAVGWPLVNGNAGGIVAFVGGRSTVESSNLKAALRDRVPPYMIPERVIALEQLPLSANGKVDRQSLRALLEEEANRC